MSKARDNSVKKINTSQLPLAGDVLTFDESDDEFQPKPTIITYDNGSSGLSATTVQDALIEIAALIIT